MLNPKELALKSSEELARMVAELTASARDIRFKIATRQNAKVRNLRAAKRDLARVLTALHRSTHSST